jgi:hypothetical protein
MFMRITPKPQFTSENHADKRERNLRVYRTGTGRGSAAMMELWITGVNAGARRKLAF